MTFAMETAPRMPEASLPALQESEGRIAEAAMAPSPLTLPPLPGDALLPAGRRSAIRRGARR